MDESIHFRKIGHLIRSPQIRSTQPFGNGGGGVVFLRF